MWFAFSVKNHLNAAQELAFILCLLQVCLQLA